MIEEFLATVRRKNEDVPDALRAHYGALYARLVVSAPALIREDMPVLVVVNTLNKQSQLVPIMGTRYLIHDQYLGQTLNELSRIFFNAESPSDAKPMAYRLAAEIAAVCDKVNIATYLGSLYSVAYHKAHAYKERESDEQRRKRMMAVDVQETYVLAHELAHLSWELGRFDPVAIDWMLDFLLMERPLGDVDAMVSDYLDDISFAYHGRAVPHTENIKTEEDRERDRATRAKLRDQFITDHARREEETALLRQEPLFREEVFADWSAAKTCLRLFGPEMEGRDLLLAIHLAMENITTLSLMTQSAYQLFNVGLSANPGIVGRRKRAMRRALEHWAAEAAPETPDWGHEVLSEANVRYMRFVRDPILHDVAIALSTSGLPDPQTLATIRENILIRWPDAADPQEIIRSKPFSLADDSPDL